MTLVTKTTFNGGELAPTVSFRSDQSKYNTGVEIMRNALPLTQGPYVRRPGLEFTSLTKNTGNKVRLIPFIFNREQAYVLEFGHNYIRILKNGAYLLDGSDAVIEIATTYTEDEIFDIHYAQSADVLFLAHQGHFPARFERYSEVSWQLVDMIVGSTQDPPAAPTGAVSGGTGRNYGYVVTAVNDETNEESIASAATIVSANSVLDTSNFVTLTWAEVSGSTLYNVYKDREESGVYGYVGSSSPVSGTCKLVDRGLVPSSDDRPPSARNPFDGAGNYPSTVTFHDQRLGFAGTANKPQTVYLSQSANFNNFNVSVPAQDDDAVTLTLASGLINRIVWMYGAKKLQVGTIGGEWAISGVDDGPITPDSIVADNNGSLGSLGLRPIYINGMTMFVQADGHTIRELRYDYVSDAYIPRDQIVYAEHLLSGRTIVDWAYQKSPYSVIWCVLDDGSFLGYSYNIEHEVAAWSRHDTDGLVESVAVVPYSTWDDVYFVVNREGVRFIERMRPYDIRQDVSDVFMVDSGATVTGTGITKVTGLSHLEGKTVTMLLDGNVWPDQVVEDGEITLPRAADKVTLGLRFTSDLVPLPAEAAPGQGVTTMLVDRTINSMRVFFYRSVGGKWGIPTRNEDGDIDLTAEHKLYEIIPRKGYQFNERLPLFTGVKKLPQPGNSGPRVTVLIRQSDPLPMNIFALTMNLEMGQK